MRLVSAALLVALAAGAAFAQPGRGGPPSAPPAVMRASLPEKAKVPSLPTPPSQPPNAKGLEQKWAQELRRAARQDAAEGYAPAEVMAAYERDAVGQWFRRGEIVVADANPAVMATAAQMGLIELRRTRLASIDIDLVTFAAPPDTDTRAALLALRERHPEAPSGLNYLYTQQGKGEAAPATTPQARRVARAVAAIIDGPIPTDGEGFTGIRFTTRRFVAGPPSPSRHGAAVAAILARSAAAADLHIIAADVVSAGPLQGAAAEDLARALDWAASQSASVINVSLTGPPHPALARMSSALAARGYIIVAAAGNAGPQAPAPYPAALSEVVGVTAVDRSGRIWRRATQGAQVDFAALGVEVATDGGPPVSGTSYAAPVVAGALARMLPAPDRARRAQVLEQLAASARDLGPPGPDATFGRGLIEPN
jgi:hypothetical protein